MKLLNGICCISSKDNSYVYKDLEDTGYNMHNIKGNDIKSIEDLFKWFKKELPQDPPLSGRVNFDALVDSLWGGFDYQGKEKVAIIWTNPMKLIKKDKDRFRILIECLKELTETLTLEEYGINKPIFLKIILVEDDNLFVELNKLIKEIQNNVIKKA
ncbi:barstar family protein [Clostridium botulinum]|uniref:Barstar (barnase inhibitor) domain-containing protein n=1 Tax=Clostridium botulinum (strain Eklund 17B / Type B) TaxID=935198 RepID=B2TIQ1_CLOBB|nr:barstar family protein [Clostridium sp. ZBS4]ACD24905.1 conserved hypothetical protein [Clostridium botulinum B str. Eklund 17B (NRP)]MBY6977523.1 barstar family protein [Clostridium botulinum]MBY7001772.1 barstar family protein [Clostridium botulinum]MCR1275452.1 barstar family protein [Clostridium botulinum]NFD70900.1 barstar family protein [Clostridium botulinum]